MRTLEVMVMATWAAVVTGRTPETASWSPRVVHVCLNRGDLGPIEMAQAEALAAEIFVAAGVKLKWTTKLDSCEGRPDAIVITLKEGAPCTGDTAALARAWVYEGTHIEVFYDRIVRMGAGNLLGHVLAHEIAHILQGVDQHAPNGVMKAVWDNAEIHDLNRRPLAFKEADVRLIHLGIEVREARATPEGSHSLDIAFRGRARQ